jgi:hypothetical protein
MSETTEQRKRAAKVCTACGETKPLDQFYRDASRGDGLDNRCRTCRGNQNRRWREEDPERTSNILRVHRERLRKAVFDHYGRTCACPGCNATTNLTIDHVNGDGRAHRDGLFAGHGRAASSEMYRWLVKNGFPDGFQTLCGPCNASKAVTEACRLDHAGVAATAGSGRRKRGKMTGQALENVRLGQQRRREREQAEREAREAGAA